MARVSTDRWKLGANQVHTLEFPKEVRRVATLGWRKSRTAKAGKRRSSLSKHVLMRPGHSIANPFADAVDYLVEPVASSRRGRGRHWGAILAGENLRKLVELVARLRQQDGCPWDREQDYDSVKGLLLEEAYEVVDAVNARDFDALEDELGDLLFQVILYSQFAAEEQRFTIDDVIDRVHAKLVRRHPHVFGETRARTLEEALKSWLAVKEGEHKADSPRSLLDGISASFPATLEAYEVGVRAAEVGFDWPKAEDLLDKIEEEVRELRREIKDSPARGARQVEPEVGDLLFAVANLARFVGTDPESCLRRANQKFRRRFQALEAELAKRGKRVQDCSSEELDAIWEQVKREESS